MSFRTKIVDKDKGYKALMARVASAKSASVEVGITAASGEPQHQNSKATVLEIATFHEFGLGVPERSFIRGWFDTFNPTARVQIAALMKSVIEGKYSKGQAMELLGVRFVAECQRYMVSAPFTPLAPSTIARKGSSKPLIDTGQLRSSITYRIGVEP